MSLRYWVFANEQLLFALQTARECGDMSEDEATLTRAFLLSEQAEAKHLLVNTRYREAAMPYPLISGYWAFNEAQLQSALAEAAEAKVIATPTAEAIHRFLSSAHVLRYKMRMEHELEGEAP